MKPFFSQELYIKAWNFSSEAHLAQTLIGSTVPYINHVGSVAMEVTAAISAVPVEDPDLSIQCALLHDTIEDTGATHEQIEAEFGRKVASGVLALTKDKTLPTKLEQMQDSLDRIRREPKEIWLVKLADRITNLQSPPSSWTKEKIVYYRDEAKLIHQNLGKAHPLLSKRLERKILYYQSIR